MERCSVRATQRRPEAAGVSLLFSLPLTVLGANLLASDALALQSKQAQSNREREVREVPGTRPCSGL